MILKLKSNVRKTHFPNSDKPVNLYNLDMILAVGYRVNSQRGIIFRRWANAILKQYLLKGYVINEPRCMAHSDSLIQINNTINNMNDRLSTLEVNVSPSEDTVWLTLDQISLLFERDKSVISRHIRNILKEQELNENSVVAFFATTASDGKRYNIKYYNLEVIISVEYRVKSERGIIFRRWANSILKRYLNILTMH